MSCGCKKKQVVPQAPPPPPPPPPQPTTASTAKIVLKEGTQIDRPPLPLQPRMNNGNRVVKKLHAMRVKR